MIKFGLPAVMLSAAMLLSGAAQAMEIQIFDRMDLDDQARYIADLVLGAEKVFKAAGQPDKAGVVEKFFTEVKQGDTNSLGIAEFEINLAKARLADARRREKDPNAKRLEVEDAMAVTLKKNGVELPESFFTVLSDFHPKLPPKK